MSSTAEIPCSGGNSDFAGFPEPTLRGPREPAGTPVAGACGAVQPDRVRNPAGDASNRCQGIGAGRIVPALDGVRIPAGRGAVHPDTGPPHRARGCRGPASHVHRCRFHTLLHHRRGRWRAGNTGEPHRRDRGDPDHRLQVGGYPPENRYARCQRHRDHDPVRHARFGGLRPA